MNCFLIDFENVKSSGLKGIEHLVENDDVYIFYSEYANTITFDVHHKINKSNANLKFFKSDIVAKNALDFQLISYLGYLIAQKKYKNYFVITGDRGFESAVSFWKDFFKQNQFTDLSINRFYNIQDALDKKSIPSKFYNKKLPPTIPTVETEIELHQLKASNVIVDRIPNQNQMENYANEKLSINDVDAKQENTSTGYSSVSSAEVKTPSQPQEHINKIKNTNKNIEKSQQLPEKPSEEKTSAVAVDSSENKQSQPQNIKSFNNKKIVNNNNNKSQNTNNNLDKEKSNNIKQSKDEKSKNKNNVPVSSNNNKKNQQQKKNNNKNKNNNNNSNNKKSQNSVSKVIKNPVVSNSKDNKKVKNTPNSNEVISNNITISTNAPTTDVSNPPKSKGFVFGKIDLNDDTSMVENIQRKQSGELLEQTSKNNVDKSNIKKEPIIKTSDLVESIAPKSIDIKEKVSVKSEPISDSKPMEIHTATDTPNDNLNNPKKGIIDTTVDTQNKTSTEVKSDKVKRKVGRPRKKPLEDQKEKPKNNKKFQEDIPNEKLEKMLDKISQLSGIGDCSKDDKVKICKIVAFSKSKQEGYQAFMSCFGKRKGVEIYKIVKQEFDALKNLYLNN